MFLFVAPLHSIYSGLFPTYKVTVKCCCCYCSCRWGETVSGLRPPMGLLLIPQMAYEHGALMELYWQGKTESQRKSCPSTTFSTTNLIWTELDAKPGLCGDKPTTNRLSHGTDDWNVNLTMIFHSVLWLRISAALLEICSYSSMSRLQDTNFLPSGLIHNLVLTNRPTEYNS
jgi:hypothetical protein